MNHERVPAVQPLERGGHPRRNLRARDTQQLVIGVRRIRQRSKNIEYCAHAELSPRPGRVLHCRVEGLREHEAEPRPLDALRDLARREIDFRPERFEKISRTATARHCPVAVLGDSGACSGRDECCRRRYIKRPLIVAARPASIQQRALNLDAQRGPVPVLVIDRVDHPSEN